MKKFILIICLSLMGFSIASQISFNSGMLSEILKFRIDFDKRSMALEDSENMLVQPEGPIFRRTGTEFIDEALTEFSYTVTDTNDSNDPNTPVYGDYTEFFFGASAETAGLVGKVTTDSNLVTDWGVNGYFSYTDPNTNDYPSICYDILQLDDGRILVCTNNFWIQAATAVDADTGKLCSAVMINEDGSRDTTWGYNGFLIVRWGTTYNYTMIPYKAFEASDGSFIFIGSGRIIKTDSSGIITTVKTSSDSPYFMSGAYDGCWIDDNKTALLLIGSISSPVVNSFPSGYWNNTMCINPSDLSVYTDWGGGLSFNGSEMVSLAGYACIGMPIDATVFTQSVIAKNIIKVDDGFIVLHDNQSDLSASMSKITLDGTAYDTNFGTDGHIQAGFQAFGVANNHLGRSLSLDSQGYLWCLTETQDTEPGVLTSQTLRKIDTSTGEVLDTHVFTSVADNVYHCINVINDYLYFGKTQQAPLYYDIEQRDTNYDLVSAINVGNITNGISVFFPDESTREITYTGGGGGETTTTTVTTLSSDKTRLIPFTYSNTDSYVLELGHNFVGFLR